MSIICIIHESFMNIPEKKYLKIFNIIVCNFTVSVFTSFHIPYKNIHTSFTSHQNNSQTVDSSQKDWVKNLLHASEFIFQLLWVFVQLSLDVLTNLCFVEL